MNTESPRPADRANREQADSPDAPHDPVRLLVEAFMARALDQASPDLTGYCAAQPAVLRDELRRRCEAALRVRQMLAGRLPPTPL